MAGKKLFLVNSRFPLSDPASSAVALPFPGEQTAALFTAFLKDTVLRYSTLDGAALRILATGEAERAHLETLFPDTDIRAYEGNTPGDVIAEAMTEALNEGAKHIFLLDSSVPTVPPRIVQSGLSILDVFEDAFIVAPIERGGFYAVGMNGYHPEVLRGIDPGTQAGYEKVISRICEFDSSVYILNSWYDVRQVEDIVQLKGELTEGPSADNAPEHTRAALEAIPLESLIPQEAKPGRS